MSLEFPGGPLQTLKCVKKSQKCLFTEKKKLSHRFWSFLVWRYPLWRNLETQNVFALGPLGGVLWAFQILPFLAYLQFLNNHILASTNDRRLVLESNIKFWNELSEKICEIFFGPKIPFFGQKGAILGTRNP